MHKRLFFCRQSILFYIFIALFLSVSFIPRAEAFTKEKVSYMPSKKKVVHKKAVFSKQKSSQAKLQSQSHLQACSSFQQKYGNKWKIRYAKDTQQVSTLLGYKTGYIPGPPEKALFTFIDKNPSLLNIQKDDIALEKIRTHRGKQHISYQQKYKGILVEGVRVNAHLTSNNEIFAVYSDYKPDIDLDTYPSITKNMAIDTVKSAMGKIKGIKEIPTAEVVVYPYENTYYLCFKVRFFCEEPLGDWVHFVDAKTGEIINGYNDLRFETTGTVSGKVFPQYGDDVPETNTFADQYV